MAVEVARTSGEVDGVRLPKEAYYACQAMWRDEPQVHLIGHWNYASGTNTTKYVVSNGEEVELLVNGRSFGRGQVSDHHLFTFPKVECESGEIKAVAYVKGKVVATQTKRTVGPPIVERERASIAGHAGVARLETASGWNLSALRAASAANVSTGQGMARCFIQPMSYSRPATIVHLERDTQAVRNVYVKAAIMHVEFVNMAPAGR